MRRYLAIFLFGLSALVYVSTIVGSLFVIVTQVANPGPEIAARQLQEAFEAHNLARARTLICAERQDLLEVQDPGLYGEVTFSSEFQVTLVSEDGDRASVRVQGKQTQVGPNYRLVDVLDYALEMKRENGKWKACPPKGTK